MLSIIRTTTVTLGAVVLAGTTLLAPGAPVAPAQAEDTLTAECTVTGGTLDWGVKEGFRSYISGTIANGGWEVSDGASYETPSFHWADPTGSIDAETGEGRISFTGTVAFNGHDGVLNLVLANPTIEFRGDGTANLLLDARSNNAQGELVVDETQVSVGRIDGLGDADPASGSVRATAAPTILTATGAEAFAGFYATGDDLDPVSLSLDFAPCAGGTGGESAGGGSANGESADVADDIAVAPLGPENNGSGVPWLPIVIGAAAIVVIVAAAILLVVTRKRPEDADSAPGGDAAAE